MMPISPTGNRGYTLIELVIAMTIGGIVLSAVYGAFRTAVMAREKSRDALAPVQEARYVFDAFRRDVRTVPHGVKAEEIMMGPGACSFPLVSEGNVKKTAVYALNGQGTLTRSLVTEPSGEPVTVQLTSGVEEVDFRKREHQDEMPGLMAEVRLKFKTCDQPYEYGVLFEISPEK